MSRPGASAGPDGDPDVSVATAGPRGLQPERTALSWQRTAIAASVAVLPLVGVDARLGNWVVGGMSAVAGVVITSFVLVLRRRVAHLGAQRLDLSPWPDIVRVCAATVILAGLGLLTALTIVLAG